LTDDLYGFTVRDGVPYLVLSPGEAAEIDDVVSAAGAAASGPYEDEFHRLAALTRLLPARVFDAVQRFRVTGKPYGGFVLSGLALDEARLGPTPSAYAYEAPAPAVKAADILLLLLGSLLGHPFSFATQQRGRLVLDVFPVRGHEEQQLGSSSTVDLEWHNEDAFHTHRADWIMLLCLRNPYGAATTFAPAHDLDVPEPSRRTLFEKRFVIFPDESHSAAFNEKTTGIEDGSEFTEAFRKVAELGAGRKFISILSGDPAAPFIRMDQAFIQRELDPQADGALDDIAAAVEKRLVDVVLDPGDVLVIDNKRAVHGRRPFVARYDGSDRWLKRANLTSDLRGSEGMRSGAHGRAIA
jgi:Fe(II)/alpha-ketoglutarate-dependent arginine beta-hydroxylase